MNMNMNMNRCALAVMALILFTQTSWAKTTCTVAGPDLTHPDAKNYTNIFVSGKTVDERLNFTTVLTDMGKPNLLVTYVADSSGQHIMVIADGKTLLGGSGSNGSHVEFFDTRLGLMAFCDKN